VKKPVAYGFSIVLIVILLGAVFSGGYLAGHASAEGLSLLPTSAPTAGTVSPTEAGTPADLAALFKPFWETWTLVHDNYVDQPVDDVALMRGAITGMLSSLGDPHTGYMSPAGWQAANGSLEGAYEGIGAYVDTTGAFLTITSPISGSPAQRAGLKPGDQIVAVDGVDMTGVDPGQVRDKVVGPAGTQVTLTVQREGVAKAFDVTLTREKILTPSVEHKMLAGGIAYVKINDFGAHTGDELKTALEDLMPRKPKGLVLDLRDNGGGYLTAAVDAASQFIKGDSIVLYEKYGDGHQQSYQTQPGGLALDIPMVVLVNKGTASASEVVSGALQDYGRAKLVGEGTYGKGSVQIWVPLSSDQGGVRVTVARWLTPKERSIEKVGLTPDVVVPAPTAPPPFSAENGGGQGGGLDPQLDKAVQILTEQ
jgi:carboxyl-terminal processing protease